MKTVLVVLLILAAGAGAWFSGLSGLFVKADQDARLSPPNLKTRVSQVIHDFNVVVIDGGAADLGVVPGSKLAVMRDGNKIAELDVNAVESRVSTATILPSTVTAGERVEAGDVVVSVRP